MVRHVHQPAGQLPFARDDDPLPPPGPNPLANKFSDAMQSHFAFGGPEQVSPEEIAYEQYVAAQRHRHAGRSQASNVILTDEVRWPSGPPPKAHGGKATQSVMHSMLTDQLPVGVGAAPPRGYFFNANGQLQQLPSHAATAARSNMSNALFGGQLEANEVSRPAPGKAQVPGRAQRTIVDALIFGHQHGDQAQAEEVIADAAGGRHGKRVIAARPSVIGEAMRWEEERLAPSAYQPRQQDDGGEHGMAMYGGSGERQPEEYNPHFPVPTYHPQKGQQQQQYQPPSQYQQQQQYQPPSQYQPQQQYQPPSQYQPQQQHYQPPTQPPPRAPQQLGSYLQQQQQQPPYSQPPRSTGGACAPSASGGSLHQWPPPRRLVRGCPRARGCRGSRSILPGEATVGDS